MQNACDVQYVAWESYYHYFHPVFSWRFITAQQTVLSKFYVDCGGISFLIPAAWIHYQACAMQ